MPQLRAVARSDGVQGAELAQPSRQTEYGGIHCHGITAGPDGHNQVFCSPQRS